jgi:hypothetical protein
MVARITLSELDLNAIGAALDERTQRLSDELSWLGRLSKTTDRDFAIACNQDALRDTVRVRLIIAAAIEEPDEEHPPAATIRMFEGMGDYETETEARFAWGDR